MTESSATAQRGGTLTADDVLFVVEQLSILGESGEAVGEAERIDVITALERLKRAAAAAQARVSVGFDEACRAQQARDGVPASKVGRGVSDQVALARMESPHRGGRHLGLAKALVAEMPCTLAALTCGDVSEWGATLVARETAVLSVEQRREVDSRLRDTLAQPGVSERRLGEAARAVAYELDPHAAVRRAAKAESDRCVTLRPAPDTMTYLTAHLPVAASVAAYASLDAAVRAAAAVGDPRTRGQVMADTLLARLIRTGGFSDTSECDEGEAAGAQPASAPVPGVVVHLVMDEDTLFGDGDTPATVVGYGPIPAPVARDLLARAAACDVAWLRRLWARPGDGQLVGLDSRSRRFPSGLAELIRLRDQVCSTPWCDAPIRHLDHPQPWAKGGSTSFENGQGLCAHCNLVKEDAGYITWRAGNATTITTPTGHTYQGAAPPLLGLPPPGPPRATDTSPTSPLEERMRQHIDAA